MTASAASATAPTDANSSGVSSSGTSGQYDGVSQTAEANGANGSGLGSALGTAGSALNIYSGLRSGSPTGYASAGLGAAQIGAKYGAFGSSSGAVGQYAGAAGNVLGIYSGLKQGGVAGYGGAAVNAAQLGSKLGAFGGASGAIGTAAGAVAIPLNLYNEVNTWRSGATGSDALAGASTGASIGATVGSVVPVIGTAFGGLVGGVIGGAAGALSSAFGPGAKDPETAGVQGLIDATSSHGNTSQIAAGVQNPYVQLAGLFDRRSSTLPMYQKYGRMGEQKFTQDFASQINGALASGQISANTPPDQVYNKVIAPWVNGMGSGWGNVGAAYTATTQGLLQDMTAQYLNGTAAQNWKAIGGDTPFSNIYQGSQIQAAPNPMAALPTNFYGRRMVGPRM